MKTLKILEIALFVIILVFGSSVFALNGKNEEMDNIFSLEDGLVAYWSFDEENDIGIDNSGSGNNGLYSSALWDSNGISGGAITFDGIYDFFYVPDSDSLDIKTNAITITAWINADSFFGEGVHSGNPIVCKWQSGRIGQYHLTAYSGGDIRFRIADGLWVQSITAEGAVTIDEWHFIAATWDGSIMKLYINGELAVEESTNITSLYQEEYNEDYLMIGYDTGGSYPYWFFDGTIDEVRIYEKTLSNEEIVNLYKNSIDLRLSFIFGKIDNLNTASGNIILFDAVKLRIIQFSPFQFLQLFSGESIKASEDYFGLVMPNYVFGFFQIKF